MGKMKEKCIEVMELIDEGMAPRQVALLTHMSVEEVVKIIEAFGPSMDFEYDENSTK